MLIIAKLREINLLILATDNTSCTLHFPSWPSIVVSKFIYLPSQFSVFKIYALDKCDGQSGNYMLTLREA